MNRKDIVNFIEQVKSEAVKISWPTKKETLSSTLTVVVMVSVCSVLFLLIDSVVHKLVQFLLKVGN